MWDRLSQRQYVGQTFIAVGLLLFSHSPGLGGKLVFDDIPEIAESSRIKSPISVGEMFQLRGLGYITLKLNHAIGGTDPFGYHVVNIAIHVLAMLSLWLVMRELLVHRAEHWPAGIGENAALLAWATALLWCVHPITTQAVAYTIQRMESLWSLAFLTGMYFYLRAQREQKQHLAWMLASIGVFWLGMGCKEPIVASLFVLPVCDWLFADHAQFNASKVSRRESAHKRNAQMGLEMLSLNSAFANWFRMRGWYYGLLFAPVIVAIPTVILPSLLSQDKAASGGLFTAVVSPIEYWSTQPEVLAHYVAKVLMPIGQCFDLMWPPQSNWLVSAAYFALIGGALALTLTGIVRRRAWSVFPLLFFANTSTTCVVPLIDLAVEHRVYLTSAWIIGASLLAIAFLLHASKIRQSLRGRMLISLTGVLSVVLASLTYVRSSGYLSPLGLWHDTVLRAPWNFRAHTNYAAELMKVKKYGDAIGELRLATTLSSFDRHPKFEQAKVYDLLASALSSKGDVEQAIQAANIAVELTPEGTDHLVRLASVYSEHGQWQPAEEALKRAIAIRPMRGDLYEHLATIYSQTRNWRSAESALLRASELSPTNDETRQTRLAQIEWMLGKTESARQRFLGTKNLDAAREAIATLSEWLISANRFEESRVLLASFSMPLHESSKSIRQIYREQFVARDYAAAKSLVTKAIQEATTDSERIDWLAESALVDFQLDDKKFALEALQQLRQQYPTHAGVWSASGDVWRWSGDENQAIQSYKKAVLLGKRDSYLLNNLGLLLASRDPQLAESYHRQSIEIDASNYQAWHNLGNSMVRQNRIDDAIACYNRALEINPTFKPSLDTLVKLESAVSAP